MLSAIVVLVISLYGFYRDLLSSITFMNSFHSSFMYELVLLVHVLLLLVCGLLLSLDMYCYD